MDDKTVERGERIQSYLESTTYRSAGLGLTRDTRATVDQVLDPKTVAIIKKLIKQGYFDELAGCISTGKEANVYFGVKDGHAFSAVKVYKTSILGFRDRDEYVDGEFRFRKGYCKSNPRKMVSLWAEKEQRNLNRIRRAGIECPFVITCKRNVLVMSLIGSSDRAAPRLKDYCGGLSGELWIGLYKQVILAMRRMFQNAKLVHGDLSEYNLLVDENRIVMIDVSQSVGLDHPRSMEFLKRDCLNINQFFRRKIQGGVVSVRELFNFITATDIDTEVRLEKIFQEERGKYDEADTVFLQTWVPSSLEEVGDLKEVERVMEDRRNGVDTVFDSLLSKIPDSNVDDDGSEMSDSSSCDGATSSSSGCSSSRSDDLPHDETLSADGSEDAGAFRNGHRPPGMSKHDWKIKVKQEQREKRRNKVPKYRKHKRNLRKYGKK
jgi:RIO kinase 1